MKIKCRPDDFIVEEIPGLPEDSRGEFRIYRLEKTGWTTPDALAFIRRAWDIKPTRMGYGGLKDRHAKTIQYFTIHGGPERKIQQPGIEAFPVASAREPFHSRHIVANRFTVVTRAIDLATLPILENALKNISSLEFRITSTISALVLSAVRVSHLSANCCAREILKTPFERPWRADTPMTSLRPSAKSKYFETVGVTGRD